MQEMDAGCFGQANLKRKSDSLSDKSSYQPDKKPKLSHISATAQEAAVTDGAREHEPHEPYYSANFKAVLSTVLSSSPERHVISKDDARTVERFMAMQEPQQQLYVRLFLRKHQWIRVGKLSYEDIAADLSPILAGLSEAGLLVKEEHLTDSNELLNLLQLGELKSVCKEMNLPASVVGSQKAKIVDSLFRHSRQHRPLFGKATFLGAVMKKAKSAIGHCVKVCEGPVETFSKLILLFSLTDSSSLYGVEGNGFSQIIFRMLQVNTGRITYPEYEINVTRPLFATEEDFIKYYEAVKEQQQLLLSMEDKDTVAVDAAVKRAREKLAMEVQEIAALKSCTEERCNGKLVPQDSSQLARTLQTSGPDLSLCDTTNLPLPVYLRRFTCGWVHASMLSHCVEFLEKQRRYQEATEILIELLAQDWFCDSSRGRWWDRLALNLEFHLGKKEECLDAITHALADTTVHPARRLALVQRAQKLSNSRSQQQKKGRQSSSSSEKRRKSDGEDSLAFKPSDFPELNLTPVPEVTITGRLLQNDVRPMYIASSGLGSPTSSQTLTGVEGYAAYHYTHTEGWPCALHAEGSSFSAMFCLLMWNVIFSPGVPDVFRSSCQCAPLDLFSDQFYTNRRDLIDAKLQWIRTALPEEIGDAVGQCWEENHGKVCAGMNWELFLSMEDAKALSMCMGGELLGHVCERFARNFAGSSGGLPDLTLWNPQERTCKFVEVKGPGDRLSHKQIMWLSDLARWQCQVEVCRVKATRS